MTAVDLSGFAKRNLWPLPSGEIAIRPGLHIHNSYTNCVGGFTVRSHFNNETWKYIFQETSAGTSQYYCNLLIQEGFDLGYPTACLRTDALKTPNVVTYAIVLDQIVIASPEFSTLWGYSGGPMVEMTYIESDNPSTPAIQTIPKGITIGWQNRCVIASGKTLYFSDTVTSSGGGPRTFVAENAVDVPGAGIVYGLHIGRGGDLFVVTDNGTFAMSPDAATQGPHVLGMLSRVSDYVSPGYGTSCSSRGRIFGLTERGFRVIDTEEYEEVFLDEPRVNTVLHQRLAHDDWRKAKIFGGVAGPVIAHPEGNAVFMMDLSRQFGSWWTFTHDYPNFTKGLLYNDWGEEFFLTDENLYSISGNFDGDPSTVAEEAVTAKGGYVGTAIQADSESPVVRRTDYATDSNGVVSVSIGGAREYSTNTVQPAIGTATWNTNATLTAKEVRSQRQHWAVRTDDIGVEVVAENPLSRMPPRLDVTLKGPGAKRP